MAYGRLIICTPRTHDLLHLSNIDGLVPDDAPPWVMESLTATPWVVVRRATATSGRVAVGVRGLNRWQRHGLFIPIDRVAARTSPEDLATVDARPCRLPAFQALAQVRILLHNTNLRWGPVGSVGFQLATGAGTVGPDSDLDIIVRVRHLESSIRAQLTLVDEILRGCPARVDCQVETPSGAVALTELVSGSTHLLVRTTSGTHLVPAEQLVP